eukprot:scpid90302/ scgid26031/ 
MRTPHPAVALWFYASRHDEEMRRTQVSLFCNLNLLVLKLLNKQPGLPLPLQSHELVACTDVCGCRTCSTKPGSSHLTSSTTTSESVEDSSDSSDCGSDSDPEPADQNDAAT